MEEPVRHFPIEVYECMNCKYSYRYHVNAHGPYMHGYRVHFIRSLLIAIQLGTNGWLPAIPSELAGVL